MEAIEARLPPPTPAEVKQARLRAGLTQSEAARLITAAKTKPAATWQGYEASLERKDHRDIPLAIWELFLLLTGQHPNFRITAK